MIHAENNSSSASSIPTSPAPGLSPQHFMEGQHLEPPQVIMATANFQDLASYKVSEGINRLKSQGKLCDVTIAVKRKYFYCHGVVIASVSKYFELKLAPTQLRRNDNRIVVDHEDVSPEMFGCLLDILYLGTDLITKSTAKDFLKMSLYLEIDFLQNYCEEFLLRNITPDDILGLWQFAQTYKLTIFAKKCSWWAAQNIDQLPRAEFLTLPKPMLLVLLSLQKKLSVDDTCEIILSWVEADLQTRQSYLSDLLPFVCFPLLSSTYLSDLKWYLQHQLSNVLSDGINEALTFHLKCIIDKDANLQREILAQQSVKLTLPDIQSVYVVVAAEQHTSGRLNQDIFAISCENSVETYYSLTPFPNKIGVHFAVVPQWW